jgi:hypothetical protein
VTYYSIAVKTSALPTVVLATVFFGSFAAHSARAAEVAPEKSKPHGVVVVAVGSKATEPDNRASLLHWQLAQGLYARAGLRPEGLTEDKARAYLGEPTTPAGLDDETQRLPVLLTIAREANAEGCVFVRPLEPGQSVAQLYVAKTGKWATGIFSSADWTQALDAFEAELSKDPDHLAVASAKPKKPSERSSFYQSGWFWAAVGGAVVLGGLAFILTQTKSSSANATQTTTAVKTAAVPFSFWPRYAVQSAGFSW